MGLDAYGKRYCHVQVLQNGFPPINRRAQEMVLVGSDGYVRTLKDEEMPEFIMFHPRMKEDSKSFVEVCLNEPMRNRPQVALVELRPRWPRNRDILHMALPLVALGLMRLLVAFAQQ